MSEPDIDWYIQHMQEMLAEIDKLVLSTQGSLTNSMKEIISHNTNEIEINLFIIIRKLKK